MKNYLIYFLQVNLGLLIFYLTYYLGLRRSKHHLHLRFFLLASALFSMFIPFVSIYTPKSNTLIELDLQEILIYRLNGNTIGVSELSIASIVSSIYFIGFAITAMVIIYQLLGIIYIIWKGEKYQRNGYVLVRANTKTSPFSFFRYLIVDKNTDEPENEIIIHEKVHIRQLHSVDVLFMEALKIVFWFNPIIYLYKNSLKELHEYLADKEVLRETEKPEIYVNLIMAQALGVKPAELTNTFFNSNILAKRIKAIYSDKRSNYKLRWFHWIMIFICIAITTKTTQILAEPNWLESNKKIFTTVDIMPEYPGGISELSKFIGNQITYPTSLMEQNIQGTVYVKFVIDENGEVSQIQKLKGVHPQLDKAALGAIRNMAGWIPGKQDGKSVPVSLTLPIKFAL